MKDTLKAIKLNEGTISMILGAIVVIVVGVLVINYFRNLKTQIPPSIGESGAQQQQTSPPTEHTVVQGEHLWGLAQKYYGSGYNWTDIAKANNLRNPNRLLVNEKLTIPQAEPKLAQLPQTGVSAAEQTSISGDSYTVVKGDHLWGVAVRAYGDGYQWVKIAQENKLKNPNLIYPGNNLALPR